MFKKFTITLILVAAHVALSEIYAQRSLSVNNAESKRTSNAAWMSGKWGVGTIIPTGERDMDVEAFTRQIADIPGVSYVLVNLSRNAHGDKYSSYHPILKSLDKDATPSAENDLLMRVAKALDKMNMPMFVYVASEGPAKLKRNKHSPHDSKWKQYVLNELYPDEPGSDVDKFKRAYAEVVIAEYAKRFGDLIDGWWFDHAVYANIPLLHEVITKHNPKAVLAFNVGQKVPLVNNSPGYEDMTAGHVTPLETHPPNTQKNLPMIESIEKSDGGFVGDPPSLCHILMPMQRKWFMGADVWEEEQAREWMSRTIKAGGAWTWCIASDRDGGVMNPERVKLLKKIVGEMGSKTQE